MGLSPATNLDTDTIGERKLINLVSELGWEKPERECLLFRLRLFEGLGFALVRGTSAHIVNQTRA